MGGWKLLRRLLFGVGRDIFFVVVLSFAAEVGGMD